MFSPIGPYKESFDVSNALVKRFLSLTHTQIHYIHIYTYTYTFSTWRTKYPFGRCASWNSLSSLTRPYTFYSESFSKYRTQLIIIKYKNERLVV